MSSLKASLPPMAELIDTCLLAAVPPGVTVIADVQADSAQSVPLVTWFFINGGQVSYGLWEGQLVLRLTCEAKDAHRISSHIYKELQGWNQPDNAILASAKVAVETLEDRLVFDTAFDGVVNGKDLIQFNSQFDLQIRDFS